MLRRFDFLFFEGSNFTVSWVFRFFIYLFIFYLGTYFAGWGFWFISFIVLALAIVAGLSRYTR